MAALLGASWAQAAVYRWVDENGNVQFSQQRPSGQPAQEVRVPAGHVTPEQAQSELQRLKEKAGMVPAQEARPEGEPEKRPEPTPEQEEKIQQQRAENCRIARENPNILETTPSRAMVKDEQGNLVRPDAEMRAAKIEEARRDIAANCD
jgi:hypothetical protein